MQQPIKYMFMFLLYLLSYDWFSMINGSFTLYPNLTTFIIRDIFFILFLFSLKKIPKENTYHGIGFLLFIITLFSLLYLDVKWLTLYNSKALNNENKEQILVATTTEAKKEIENTYIPPKKVVPVKKPIVKKVDTQKVLNQECNSKVPGSIYSQQFKQCVCPPGWYYFVGGCTYDAG